MFPLLILWLLVVRPIFVFLHELGHATFALIYTNHNVSIILGNQYYIENSLYLRIGRLNIWLHYMPPMWINGLCKVEIVNFPPMIMIFYVLGGILYELLFGVFLYIFLYSYGFHYEAFMFLFFIFVDVLIQLFFFPKPIKVIDGNYIFSDSKQLLHIIRNWKKYQRTYKLVKMKQTERILMKGGQSPLSNAKSIPQVAHTETQ